MHLREVNHSEDIKHIGNIVTESLFHCCIIKQPSVATYDHGDDNVCMTFGVGKATAEIILRAILGRKSRSSPSLALTVEMSESCDATV